MDQPQHTITIRLLSMLPFKDTLNNMFASNKTPGNPTSNGFKGPQFDADVYSGDQRHFDPQGKCLGHVQTGKVEIHVTPKTAIGWGWVMFLLGEIATTKPSDEPLGDSNDRKAQT